MKKLLPFLLFAAPIATGLQACVGAAAVGTGAASMSVAQERPTGQAIDDATGALELKTKLLAAEGYHLGNVDVEMAGGLVVLSGTVPRSEDRYEAERLAWTTPNVQEVGNELNVGRYPTGYRNLGDELVTSKVRARILADQRVRSINFNVETHDRVVYLLGYARSEQEIAALAETASLVEGVDKVVSYVKIR